MTAAKRCPRSGFPPANWFSSPRTFRLLAGGVSRVEAGSATARPARLKAAGSIVVRFAQLTLKLDEKSGAIASLRATAWIMNSSTPRRHLGLNAYVYLPGGNVKDAQRNGPAKISVKENGPLVASLLVESDAPGCNKLTREIRLVDGLDRVEIMDTMDKKADARQLKACISASASTFPIRRCASTFRGR